MKVEDVYDLLERIKGCTFASLDAETHPSKGIVRVVRNEKVILFTNKTGSGYENMVKRRLEEIGKDPDMFTVGDLPWGERIPETPVIVCNDKYYLQTILLHEGEVSAFLLGTEVDPEKVLRKPRPMQGLGERSVIVQTYLIDNITSIRLLGEERPMRETLRLKH